MAEISAAQVGDLRDRTGAGMMDCKKALVAADGNIDDAIELLRKSGAAKAAKRAGRTTSEGMIVARIDGGSAVLSEVLCETDFVAKNENFVAFCDDVAAAASAMAAAGDVSEAIHSAKQDDLAQLITTTGENVRIGRVARWQPTGKCESYLHMGGKIGVLVDVEGDADVEYLKNLCMHVAAFNPQFIGPDDVADDVIAKEKEIAAAQPDLSGKPEEILDKILDGKIRKWFTENCLTKQAWIRDDKTTVEKVNPNARILRFLRWQVGEAD
jgi:elongation factor Ts